MLIGKHQTQCNVEVGSSKGVTIDVADALAPVRTKIDHIGTI